MTIRVDFSRCLAQQRAHEHFQPGNRVCLPWGRGIGKSWFTRTLWYLSVIQWDGKLRPKADRPGVRIVLLMPTLEQARKVHGDLLSEELEDTWALLGGRLNRSTWRINFPGGSWIQWVTAERAQNVRGIRCDMVFIDEADDIEPGVVESIVKPWFSEPHSLRQIVVSGTPRRGRKGQLWRAHREWPAIHPTKAFSFHATAYDAPSIVDPAYVEEIRKDTPETIFKREWLCDFDSAEGLVFPMFSETFHVRQPPANAQWSGHLVGGDHGFEDPGVLLYIGLLGTGRDTTAWVLDEIVAQHMVPTWWQATAQAWVRTNRHALWYCDSARPDLNALYKAAGAKMRDVVKGPGSIEAGVGMMQRWLQPRERESARARSWPAGLVPPEEFAPRESFARLYVSPKCKRTIDEFGMYRRRRDARNTESVLEDIEDKNNHCMDALRYAIQNHFPDEAASYRLGNLAPG